MQKLLNGRFDLGEGGTGTYPPFLFALFDGDGNPIRYNSGDKVPVTTTVNGVETTEEMYKQVTVWSDEHGKASFDLDGITNNEGDPYIDLTRMRWWDDEKKLYGKYTFYIMEQEDRKEGDSYNGITNVTESAKAVLNVYYDWLTGKIFYLNDHLYNPPEGEAPYRITVGTRTNDTYHSVNINTVRKVWDDDDNRDGLRPDQTVTVKLVAKVGNEEISYAQLGHEESYFTKELTISNADTENPNIWVLNNVNWTGLPKYYEGKLIEYTLLETPDFSTYSDQTQTVALTKDETNSTTQNHTYNGALTNTHTPQTVDISANKAWNHSGNSIEHYPITAKLCLVATVDGSEANTTTKAAIAGNNFEWEKTLTFASADAQQTVDWGNLPCYVPGREGAEITYSVAEVELRDNANNVLDGYPSSFREEPVSALERDIHALPEIGDLIFRVNAVGQRLAVGIEPAGVDAGVVRAADVAVDAVADHQRVAGRGPLPLQRQQKQLGPGLRRAHLLGDHHVGDVPRQRRAGEATFLDGRDAVGDDHHRQRRGDRPHHVQRVGQQYALLAQQLDEALRRPSRVARHRVARKEAGEALPPQRILGEPPLLQLRPAFEVTRLVLLVAVGVAVAQLVHQAVHRDTVPRLEVHQRVVVVEEYDLVAHGEAPFGTGVRVFTEPL